MFQHTAIAFRHMQPFHAKTGYKDAAVSFFAEVGDLGGASAAGPIGKDPEQVAALPPQNQ